MEIQRDSIVLRAITHQCHKNWSLPFTVQRPRAARVSTEAILCRVLIPKPRFKGLDLIDRVSDKLGMEVCDFVQQTIIKTTPKKNKCKKAKCLFEEHLIHFEFSFAYGVRKGCGFILLQLVDFFFFPHHQLLKRLSFLHCIFFLPLSKLRCS